MGAVQLEGPELEATIDDFQRKLERLKILYEQYFMGIEKREPTIPRTEVVRLMHLLDQQNIRNNGLRYRYRVLIQRFNSYKTYWNRTLREKEAGTYHRDLAKLRRKQDRQAAAAPVSGKMSNAAALAHLDGADTRPSTGLQQPAVPTPQLPQQVREVAESTPELYEMDNGVPSLPSTPAPVPVRRTFVARVAAPHPMSTSAAPAGAASPPSLPASAPQPPTPRAPQRTEYGAEDARMQSLYRRLAKAKQMCGDATDSVPYETLVSSVQRQLPKLKEMYPGKEIEFQVVVRGGKAVLKAQPK